jgi:hypothetical protein
VTGENLPPEAGASAEAEAEAEGPTAARLAAQLLEPDDPPYVEALRRVGLLGELDGDELLRIAHEVEEPVPERRRLDLLELYYEAAGDLPVADRRRKADRFFLPRAGEVTTAKELVARLAELFPELGEVHLERASTGGPVVLRAGVALAPLVDDEGRDAGDRTVSLRALVRAANVLAAEAGIRERLVGLRSDGRREPYVGLGLAEAVELARAGHLEETESERLLELASW